MEGVVNVTDDLPVWGEDKDQHDKRLRQLLDRIKVQVNFIHIVPNHNKS